MNVPLNIDWQQILLHLFNFILLFAILYFLLYKPIKDFMDKRTQYYKDMEDKAKANLSDAEKTKADYEKKLASCEDEIAKIKSDAIDDAAKTRNELIAKAKTESDELLSQAKKKASDEHDRMISEAKNEIAEMVSIATEKIVIGEKVSDSFDAFLDTVDKNGDSNE